MVNTATLSEWVSVCEWCVCVQVCICPNAVRTYCIFACDWSVSCVDGHHLFPINLEYFGISGDFSYFRSPLFLWLKWKTVQLTPHKFKILTRHTAYQTQHSFRKRHKLVIHDLLWILDITYKNLVSQRNILVAVELEGKCFYQTISWFCLLIVTLRFSLGKSAIILRMGEVTLLLLLIFQYKYVLYRNWNWTDCKLFIRKIVLCQI